MYSPVTAILALSHFNVPEGAWDGHMHVTDLEQFPPPSTQLDFATYSPSNITLTEALSNANALALPNLVFIQPSTYGTDNSCVLWCLKQLPHQNARGVVAIDPNNITEKTLLEWHGLGVRGVRINLKSFDARPSYEELRDMIESIHRVLRVVPSWGIHFYTDLTKISAISAITRDLDRKICIDHMACPTPDMIREQVSQDLEIWAALREMLERPNVFIKISAPYRAVEPSLWMGLEDLVKEFLSCRYGDAAVFASDWPHTRFPGIDIAPWRDLCLHWCGEDEGLRDKLFVKNAERLYDV